MQQRLRYGACRSHWQPDRLLLEQHSFLALNQCGVEIGVCKRWAAYHVTQELHVGVEPDDANLRQRIVQPGQRFFARLAVHDQLGHHRVVKRRNGVAFSHTVINAGRAAFKTGAFRLLVNVQRTRGWQKVVIGVFSANAGLNSVAIHTQLVLRQWQPLA